jgi:hypothetical protein
MDVTFEIAGRTGTPSQRVAEMIAENLRCYGNGGFARDGAILTDAGVDPQWLTGAQAAADVMEDTLVGRRHGAIPLDPSGKAADALAQALRLTGPASFDAHSEHARLLATIREAQAG